MILGLAVQAGDPGVLVSPISHLGEAGTPAAGLFRAALCALAVSTLCLAGVLRERVGGAGFAVACLALAAAGLLAAAAFPLDPGSIRLTTLHRIAAPFAFSALTVAALASAQPLARQPGARRLAMASFWIGVAATSLLLATLVAFLNGLRVGLLEWPLAAMLAAWLEAVAVALGSARHQRR